MDVASGVWRDCGMRALRLEGLLTASALAIVFIATSGLPAGAGVSEDRAITAAIPVPEPANLPPPSAADIGAPQIAAATPAAADIDARVPMPESANVPPPSLKDVGGPVTGATEPKAPDAAPAAPPATEMTQPAAPPAVAENPVTTAMRELMGS